MRPAIGHHGSGIRQTIALARDLKIVEQDLSASCGPSIGGGAPRTRGKLVPQPGRATRMVDMAMRQQDAVDVDAEFVDRREQTVDFSARIDNHAMLSRVIP